MLMSLDISTEKPSALAEGSSQVLQIDKEMFSAAGDIASEKGIIYGVYYYE